MKSIFSIFFSFAFSLAFAQIKQSEATISSEEQIKQGEVTVQRNYEPNVSAAEKIKQIPITQPPAKKKQPLTYQPGDIAAASEFKTSNINPVQLPVSSATPYENYLMAGYGTNATLRLNAFLNYHLDEDKSVGVNGSYLGTKANLEKYSIYNNTNDAKLNAEGFFNYNLTDALFTVTAGVGLHRLNLYGIPITKNTMPEDSKKEVTQRFTKVYVNSKYNVYNGSILKKLATNAYYFSNNFGSNEIGFNANGWLNTGALYEGDFFGGVILGGNAQLNLNYGYTQFSGNETKYNYLNLGITPKIEVKNDYFNLFAGINLQYINSVDEPNVDNPKKIRIFPKAQLNINATPEFNLYGGISGGVKLNNYQEFAKENPYLSPSQQLIPTINKLEFFAGIKGDIGSNFKYNAKAGIQDLENEFFFTKNPYALNPKAYEYGNSFVASYDNADRTYILGSINFIGIEKLSLGANLNFQNYRLKNLKYAYEKPTLSGDVNAQYTFLDERLILGSTLLFKGKRKGLRMGNCPDCNNIEIVDLNPYLDLSFSANFLLNEQWTIFAEANNLFNNNYERFLDYRVQGLTILGGVQFKF